MKESMNKPYVKIYDSNGKVKNEITKNNPYITEGDNRRERREYMNEPRFIGNGKNYHLTVINKEKFKRVLQKVYYNIRKNLPFVNIEHYITHIKTEKEPKY